MPHALQTFGIPLKEAFIHLPATLSPEGSQAWTRYLGHLSLVPPGQLPNPLIDDDGRLDPKAEMSLADVFDEAVQITTESVQGGASSTRTAGEKVAVTLMGKGFKIDEFKAQVNELRAAVPFRNSALKKLQKQAEMVSNDPAAASLYLSADLQETIHMPCITEEPKRKRFHFGARQVEAKLKLQAKVAAKQAKDDQEPKVSMHMYALSVEEQRALVIQPLRTPKVILRLGGPHMLRKMVNSLRACEELQDYRLKKEDVLTAKHSQKTSNALDGFIGQAGEMVVEGAFVPIRNLVRTSVLPLPLARRSLIFYPQGIVGQEASLDHYIARPKPQQDQDCDNLLKVDVLGVLDIKSPQALSLRSLKRFLEGLVRLSQRRDVQTLRMVYDGEKWKKTWAFQETGMTQAIADEILQIVEASLMTGCRNGCLSALQHFIVLDTTSIKTDAVKVTLSPALDGSNPIMSFPKWLLGTALSPTPKSLDNDHRAKSMTAKLKKHFDWAKLFN